MPASLLARFCLVLLILVPVGISSVGPGGGGMVGDAGASAAALVSENSAGSSVDTVPPSPVAGLVVLTDATFLQPEVTAPVAAIDDPAPVAIPAVKPDRPFAVQAGSLASLHDWQYESDPFANQAHDLGNLWGMAAGTGTRSNAVKFEVSGTEPLDFAVLWTPHNDMVVTTLNLSLQSWTARLSRFQHRADNGGKHVAWALTGQFNANTGTLGYGFLVESDIGGRYQDDRASARLGWTQNLGGGSLKAQVSHSASGSGRYDGTQWALGYDYPLRDNLVLYGAVSVIRNCPRASFAPPALARHGSPLPGDDPFSVSVGLVFKPRWLASR